MFCLLYRKGTSGMMKQYEFMKQKKKAKNEEQGEARNTAKNAV